MWRALWYLPTATRRGLHSITSLYFVAIQAVTKHFILVILANVIPLRQNRPSLVMHRKLCALEQETMPAFENLRPLAQAEILTSLLRFAVGAMLNLLIFSAELFWRPYDFLY